MKRNSIEIMRTYIGKRNSNKIKSIWATTAQLFEKYWFHFFLVVFFKQNTSRYQVPLTELCYLEEERYISRAFLNYDVIFYTFQDIKDYLKNLSTRKRVSYNCKYFNEY